MFTRPVVLPDWATAENNGRLDDCHLERALGGARIEKNARVSWDFLVNECLKAGVVLTYTGIYRTLQQQQDLWEERGGQGVARPGTSKHGWGLAVDMSINGYGAGAVAIDNHALDVVAWILIGHQLPWAWEGTPGGRNFERWHLNCTG